MFLESKRYLITTDNWFVAPDNRTYNAAWGKVKVVKDTELGISANKNSSNWFVIVGDDENSIIISGDRIHYAILCSKTPDQNGAYSWSTSDHHAKMYEYFHENRIWVAE